jgi:hypothetical protein
VAPVLRDTVRVLRRPSRGFAAAGEAASPRRAGLLVAGTGIGATALSAAAIALEPGDLNRAAGYAVSLLLPVLFTGFWLVDGFIVDAVAQLMGVPTRLQRWLTASAYVIPLLLLYEVVRLAQAAIDRAGATDLATALGFTDFLVLGWFLALITLGIRMVYGLEGLSAFSAALAPPAAMATLVVALLVVFSGLHAAGVG